MQKAWAIGLYSYSSPTVSADEFKRFYDVILELFATLGVAPTYIGVEGAGFKDNFTKFAGRNHFKLLNREFADIQVLSLVSNPEGSDAPGYDSHCSASLAFVEAHDTLLCVSIEERFADFGGSVFEACLNRLLQLKQWDFGFAFCQPIQKKPEFHVLGLNGGDLSIEDRRRLNAWYAALPATRLSSLRDVYPYLILNQQQLTRNLSDAGCLRDKVLGDKRLSLAPIRNSQLFLLKTPIEVLEDLRKELSGLGILIT